MRKASTWVEFQIVLCFKGEEKKNKCKTKLKSDLLRLVQGLGFRRQIASSKGLGFRVLLPTREVFNPNTMWQKLMEKNSHENLQKEILNWVGYGLGFYTIGASSIGNILQQHKDKHSFKTSHTLFLCVVGLKTSKIFSILHGASDYRHTIIVMSRL